VQIDEINDCLYDPDCYQEKGLTNLTEALEKVQEEYEALSERYLELRQIINTPTPQKRAEVNGIIVGVRALRPTA